MRAGRKGRGAESRPKIRTVKKSTHVLGTSWQVVVDFLQSDVPSYKWLCSGGSWVKSRGRTATTIKVDSVDSLVVSPCIAFGFKFSRGKRPLSISHTKYRSPVNVEKALGVTSATLSAAVALLAAGTSCF
ncbi:hypothetical protein HZH68_006471 [Vespula germanica]|uniref:Uncharacterized protein n=1 Tax=Vespula germanica TaxID=30212 RepID=A0A834KCY5_VESGE|nr:hypothetical protein HZH68_006471 [Vespula germanica]